MKFTSIIFLFCILCFSCTEERPVKERADGLTILHLEGSPYERGFLHGSLLKEEIHIILEAWKAGLPVPPIDYPGEIVQAYLDIVEKEAPDVLEEVRGIADGAGQDLMDLFALQIGEELENIDTRNGKHCTSINTNQPLNEPVIVAQNMDAPPFLHGFPLLLHLVEPGMETFIFTSPGLIGQNGMNSKGLAIACNSMSMLKNDQQGMPVAFIVRKFLQQENFEEALEFLENTNHSTPQAYTIGGIDTTVCLECSPAGCFPFFAFPEAGIGLHTNFAIVNRDFNEQFVQLLSEFGKTIDDPYYCPRYFKAYDIVADKQFRLDPPAVMDMLSDTASELETISNENTYGSLVMVLGSRPKLFIAPDRPDSTVYMELHFDRFSD